MRRTPPLDELQPPPYQDDSGSPHLSCTPSEIGDSKCEFSHCSNSPRCSYNKCPSEGSAGHEIESFHNKGFEEDVPSDSTAVLSPEVSKSTQSVEINVIWKIILCFSSWSEGFITIVSLWLTVSIFIQQNFQGCPTHPSTPPQKKDGLIKLRAIYKMLKSIFPDISTPVGV